MGIVVPYHRVMISQQQFGNASNNPVTVSKSAVAENPKYDGPGGLKISNFQDKFVPNKSMSLPKPGFGD